MIVKPLATESAVTDAAITAARVVRLVNSHATNTSSIPELTGKYASLIESRNHEAIIESTIKILSDYDKYKEIAIKGRQHVIEHFNWAKITKEYENTIYETIKEFKNADI